MLVRAGCGLVAGCSPPPRPPVRPPWGGLPSVPPLFPFPVARRFSATAYPFPPPAGGQPTLRRAGLPIIASLRQGSGQVTPLGVTLDKARSQLAIIAAPAWVGVVPLGVFLLFITSGYFCLRQGGVWLVAWSGGRRVGCRLRSGDRLVGWVDDQPPARVWSVHLAGANSAALWSAGGVRDVRPLVGASFVGWALRRRARPPPLVGTIYPG